MTENTVQISQPKEYLSVSDIQAALGCHRSTADNIVHLFGCPEPVYFAKRPKWRASTLFEWIDKEFSHGGKYECVFEKPVKI